MKSGATGLFLGILVGAFGLLLVQRIQSNLQEDDVDKLADRLAGQLEDLEDRLTHTTPV